MPVGEMIKMFNLIDFIDENKHPIITWIIVMGLIYILCTLIPGLVLISIGFNISLKNILTMGTIIYGVFFVWWFCQMGNRM